MQPLWADLAEYSCRWAFGATTSAQVRQQMTEGMHFSNRCPWNQNVYNSTVMNIHGGFGPVKLGVYLTGMNDPWIPMPPNTAITYETDCRGFAAILKLAMQAQGTEAIVQRVERSERDWMNHPLKFYYWPLCPAGLDPASDNNFSDLRSSDEGWFNFHVVVQSNGQRYDSAPSYKYNLNGTSRRNPVWDWDLAPHWQSPSGGEFRGLVYSKTYKCAFNYSPSELVPGLGFDFEPTAVTAAP
jgi:hypothetical protein